MGFGSPKMLASADEARAYALALVRAFVPSDFGDPSFTAILGEPSSRAGDKGYSSCGDLASFLLWALGVRDRTIVNREPWLPGANISRLVGGAKKLGAWKAFDGSNAAPGDIYFLGGDGTGPEHVGIYLGDGDEIGTWHTADAGQTNAATGKQAARLYPFTDERGGAHKRVLARKGSAWTLGGRTIRGLVDPTLLRYDAETLPIPGEPTDEEDAAASGQNTNDGEPVATVRSGSLLDVAAKVAAGIGVAVAAWELWKAIFGERET